MEATSNTESSRVSPMAARDDLTRRSHGTQCNRLAAGTLGSGLPSDRIKHDEIHQSKSNHRRRLGAPSRCSQVCLQPIEEDTCCGL